MFKVERYDPAKEQQQGSSQLVVAKDDAVKHQQNPDHMLSGNKNRKRSRGLDMTAKVRNDSTGDISHPKKKMAPIAPDHMEGVRHQKNVVNELQRSKPSTTAQEAFDDLDLILLNPDEDEEVRDDVANETVNVGEASVSEIKMSLAMAKLPLEEAARRWNLLPALVESLQQDGFRNFFPVQALAIVDILLSDAQFEQQDICITAPTGSGKTLAYCLPIIHSLASRPRGRQLRALVILPSRDLATQVYQVFEQYVQGCDLKVGIAIGQTNFTAEQISLTVDVHSNDPAMLRHRLSFDPGNLELAMEARQSSFHLESEETCWSTVDILVCTPGRLVDHLDHTPGFSLQNLQFLVVDEADRLMNQQYHNWLARVVVPPMIHKEELDWSHRPSHGQQLRKILVSATLTRDPQKLAALRLNNPKHLNAHHLNTEESVSKLYSMPDSLREYTLECTAEQKPLVLLAILADLALEQGKLVVVFTSSLDSTHRLARLMQLLWPFVGARERVRGGVLEFSSALNQSERASLVSRCKETPSDVAAIICSDGMSRGMDLQNVGAVIHYDVPTAAKTYVHRSGRTARAGTVGTAIVLLKGAGQAGQFRKLRTLIQSPERVITGYKVRKQLVHDVPYRECLTSLREVLVGEEAGELKPTDPLPIDYIPLLDDAEGTVIGDETEDTLIADDTEEIMSADDE